jgi:uncharacterized protein YggE
MAPAWAETALRTLTVTGQGEVSIPTSKTEIHLGVEVQGPTAVAAQTGAAAKSTAVIELLQSRNVENLQTVGIRLNPRYNYVNGSQRLEGFIATNTVRFQVPTDQAGDLIDRAVQAGASQINEIRFIAPEGTIAAAQDQALQGATADARRQANAVLSSLGLTAQEIITIQVNGSSPPPAPLLRAVATEAAVSTPVVGAEQTVRASVTLQIRY